MELFKIVTCGKKKYYEDRKKFDRWYKHHLEHYKFHLRYNLDVGFECFELKVKNGKPYWKKINDA